MLENLIVGFSNVFTPFTLVLNFIGVFVGIIFGAIPGLTGTMAFAVCLPLTFDLTPIQAMSILMGLYIGTCSGGLISAILINIPGTLSSIATTFDGSPMARNGQAGKALGIGIICSFIGGLFSFLLLFFIAPPLANFAIKFSPFEYFAVTLFSLTLIASVSGDNIAKGLASGFFGVAFSFVGLSSLDGFPRYTFGFSSLNGGLAILPVLLGIYATSELMQYSKKKNITEKNEVSTFKFKGFGFSFKELISQTWNIIRSALIGVGIGILPGIGGGTSNLISYATAKNSSKYPEKFGTGIIDGVVASETANNASIGGSLIPLLTLGIPGDTVTAIMIGALMIHGISPGPLLFIQHSDLVFTIFAALVVGNFLMVFLEFFGMRIFVKFLDVPKHILLSVVMVLCVVGTYGVNNNILDVWTLFYFGIFGTVMLFLNFPLTPFVLGFVLGPLIEINFRRAAMLARGDWTMFITKPISAIFLMLTIFSIVVFSKKEISKKMRKRNA